MTKVSIGDGVYRDDCQKKAILRSQTNGWLDGSFVLDSVCRFVEGSLGVFRDQRYQATGDRWLQERTVTVWVDWVCALSS